MGLHQDNMVLRLGEIDRLELLEIKGGHVFEPMAGRPMREYVVVPPSLLEDLNVLRQWAQKALNYGTSLKPKEKSTRGSATRGSTRKAPGGKGK